MSNQNTQPKIIAVVGPTASGKTTLAIKLAKKFSGELISVDSRQIYKEMNIGTAKETNYPHYLFNLLKPNQVFSVAEFKEKVIEAIKDILKRDKLPILVGGTGLYLNAILYNYNLPAVAADPELRQNLKQKSVEELEEELEALDPQAATVARGNKRRLIRALEVIKKTGQTFSGQKTKGEPLFNFLILGLEIPREELKKKIESRTNMMFGEGLVEEARALTQKYGPDAYALQNTIGYKELLPYFEGKTSLKKAKKEIQKNTRRYAKRQITWFKKNPDIRWVENYQEAEELIN